MFSKTIKNKLTETLDPKNVKQRSKSGFTLDYIEGWFAIEEANRIFGFEGWSRQTDELELLHEPYQNEKKNWGVSYRAKVKIEVFADGDYVVREGSGFGSGFSKQLGDAHESALKEAETDAMKRALMTFGNKFGLALYDKTKANVQDPAVAKQRKKDYNGLMKQLAECCDEETLKGLKEVSRAMYNDLAEWDQENMTEQIGWAEERVSGNSALDQQYQDKVGG